MNHAPLPTETQECSDATLSEFESFGPGRRSFFTSLAGLAGIWLLGLLCALAVWVGCDTNSGPIDDLIAQLKDEYSITREQAARKLGELGATAAKAVPALQKALLDSHKSVRRNAAEALGKIGPKAKPAIKALSRRLWDKEEMVRNRASWALGQIGEAALPELKRLVKSDYPHARYYAILALTQIKGRGIAVLKKAVRDPSRKVRRAAVEALVQRGVAYLDLVLPLLKDPQASIRAFVAWKLSSLAERVARKRPKKVAALVKALAEAVQDSSYQVRMYATYSLGKLETNALPARKELIRALKDPEWYVRKNAAAALGAIGPPAKEAIPTLAQTLMDPTWDVKHEGARAMRRIDEEATVKALIPLLSVKKWRVQRYVIQTLGWMGAASRDAVPALTLLLSSPHPEVQEATTKALASIGKPAYRYLRTQFRSSDPQVRRLAVQARGQLKGGSKLPTKALEALRDDRDFRVRHHVFVALGRLRPMKAAEAKRLCATLKQSDEAKILAALKKLQVGGKPAAACLEAVTGLAKSSSKALALAASQTLQGLGTWAPPNLAKDLLPHFAKLTDRDTRRALAYALAWMPHTPDDDLVAYTKQILDHKDARLHRAALVLLQRLKPSQKGLVVLAEMLQSPYAPIVRDTLKALHRGVMAYEGTVDDTVLQGRLLQPAAALLRHRNAAVRRNAAMFVGHLGSKAVDVVPALVRLFRDRNTEVRREAVAAMGWIGRKAHKHIPALKKMLQDRDALVRRNAVFAISRMGKHGSEPLLKLLLTKQKPQVLKNIAFAFSRIWIPPKKERKILESLKIMRLDKELPKDVHEVAATTIRKLESDDKPTIFWVDHPRSPTLEVYTPTILFPHGS